jgi:hypothetical protein
MKASFVIDLSEVLGDYGYDQPIVTLFNSIRFNLLRHVLLAEPDTIENQVSPKTGSLEFRRESLAVRYRVNHLLFGGATFL